MKSLFNSEENFNELIFENKNKEYGAYALRASQSDTVSKSLMITASVMSLLFITFFFLTRTNSKPVIDYDPNIIPPIPVQTVVEMVIPKTDPKVIPEKPRDPKPPVTNTGAFTASDDHDKTIEKTNDDLNIGKKNIDEGPAYDSAEFMEPTVLEPAVSNEPTGFPDEEAKFQGNVYQFIKDNMRYPQMAVENGTQGTVGLSFIIEKDGSIGEVKVLGRVADGCTEEAIRVVKMMPKWKPGKNHGQPVRVIFNLPVKFRLQ
ncbi:MAG: TonB family protein [Bacteroidota bacterium]|jgi:protein TonB|nr:TonB family protein [Bacteroidota bacterium]